MSAHPKPSPPRFDDEAAFFDQIRLKQAFSPHPDAELIAICDRVVREYGEFNQSEPSPNVEAVEAERFFASIKALVDSMQGIKAVTADGIAARARALQAANPSYASGPAHSFDGGDIYRMLEPLLRDAAALEAGPRSNTGAPAPSAASGIPQHSDAELIALCDRHVRLYQSHKVLFESTDQMAPQDSDRVQRQGDQILEEAVRVEEAIAAMRVTTDAGLLAVAKSFALMASGMLVNSDDEPMLNMLINDGAALAMGEVPAPVVKSDGQPDTEALFLEQVDMLKATQQRWQDAKGSRKKQAAILGDREALAGHVAMMEAMNRTQAPSLKALIAKAEWALDRWTDKPYREREFGGTFSYPLCALEQAVETLRLLPPNTPVAIVGERNVS